MVALTWVCSAAASSGAGLELRADHHIGLGDVPASESGAATTPHSSAAGWVSRAASTSGLEML
jgi:hypothetical protein